jgi:hypothetical protein
MSKLLVSAAAHRGGLAAASPGREVVERNELRALQLLLATPTSGGLSILATGLDAIVERRRVADRAGRRELRHYPALGVRSGHAVAARGLVAARRALELLAASPEGCTEALMFANGFTAEMLLELVCAGLASAHAERMVADGKMSEVARVKISDAGWRALTADVINARAKST